MHSNSTTTESSENASVRSRYLSNLSRPINISEINQFLGYLWKSDDWFITRRVIFIVVYIVSAVSFYATYENWTGFDSIYFIISTVSTVGTTLMYFFIDVRIS